MSVDIEKALVEVQDWMDLDGVHMLAQGRIDDRDCIVVAVSSMTDEVRERIPRTYKGIPVDVRVQGQASALD